MKIIHSTSNFPSHKKSFVTIGTFDGVHVGHQKILQNLIRSAKKENAKSVLLTFFPHPRMVLQKNVTIELLNTIDEKSKLLEDIGLDYLIVHPFNKAFSRLTALDFVRDILINQLNAKKLIIGYDHHFGKNREGNINQLREYSQLFDFKVQEIPAHDIDDVAVSSTKIRTALHNGLLKTANKYLGYPFMIQGTVVNGKKLGGKIGFPTANIHVKEDYKLIPKTGVYVIQTRVDNDLFFGMMNIGYRPTINGRHQTIEAHLFNFDGNLYNKFLTIEFLYFLREEQKFDTVDELILQLKKDRDNAIFFTQNKL